MADSTVPLLRAVRSAPPPLGLYIRAGRNDHLELANVIAAGGAAMFGVVFDAVNGKRHEELRHSVLERRLDAVVDLCTQQLATPGGFNKNLAKLPWALDRFHRPTDFDETKAQRFVATIADYVVENGYTAVLAPTHIVQSATGPWPEIDARLTGELREVLDRRGAGNVQIIYSLAVPYGLFRNREQRLALKVRLQITPMDALWLKVHSFGWNASATGVRNYIKACRDFHDLGVSVVADMVGGLIGLSLLAFGAAGGITHGVTQGEQCDVRHRLKPKHNGGGFSTAPRVYIPELGLLLKRTEVETLFAAQRAKGRFGCRDTACCPNGIKDMIDKPVRHFMNRRMAEVGELSQIPEQLRANRFLEQRLRPATDAAVFAEQLNLAGDAVANKMRKNRRRLENLRITLGDFAQHDAAPMFAEIPKTRVARDSGW